MTNVNPNALLRSLIMYAICVPLAIVAGFTIVNLAQYNFNDTQSLIMVAVFAAILIFPLMMRWHYVLLVMSCSLPATMFFLPGRPSMFLVMAAISLAISMVERILNRNQRFLTAGGVQWPLLAMLLVVYLTAKLTGGIGLRAMGSDVYGGKKYLYLIIGILSFFAFIARPIPRKYANLYVGLYFLGGTLNALTDLYPWVPSALHFIYLVIPASGESFGGKTVEIGVSRLAGVASAGGAIFFWMMARYGIRGCFLTSKIWRPVLLGAVILLILLGGFRTSIVGLVIIGGVLFLMQKMYQTALMPVVVFAGLFGTALLVPLAPHLPYTFQRAIAFLPVNISLEARMDAEQSTSWRLQMWQALLPQVPQYLLKGKGYSFSQETFNDYMGAGATFAHQIDASQDPLALSSDFHSGPLSVLIPFGIWGALTWIWLWAAGFRVIWRNFRYGDAELRHINIFFLALFVCKVFIFLFIFGAMSDDVGPLCALIGLSIALNHGVMAPRPRPKVNPVFGSPRPAFPARPVLQPATYQWSPRDRRETQTAHS